MNKLYGLVRYLLSGIEMFGQAVKIFITKSSHYGHKILLQPIEEDRAKCHCQILGTLRYEHYA